MISYKRIFSAKKSFFILLFAFFISITNASAQNNELINPIAKKHLSPQQIDKLTIPEINMINFMFTSSYIVDTTTEIYKKWMNDNGNIDVVLLNQRRKQSERVFCTSEKYPGFVIELMSWDELNAEVKNIVNNK
jgi:hypothetical protein